MSLTSLSICNDERYLQQEPWAFGHEREGHHRGGTGERADDDKHTPTVELVGWPHAEAPPWGRKTGGVRGSEDPTPLRASTPGSWNGQLLPRPEEWADLGISHSDQLILKMANNSAEKKGARKQSGLGLGMEVQVYFWTNCKDQGQWIWDSAFSSRLPGWVSPVCSFRSLWTLVSAVSQEPALGGPHQLAALSIGSQLGWMKEALAGEQSVGSGFRVFIPLPSLLPYPWSHGGLTVGVLIPGNLLMGPHLLSGSGNPTLLLTSEAQVSTGGPSAMSSKVLYYFVCVSLNCSCTALCSDSCWGCHCFPASTLTSTKIKNWHLPASTHIFHTLD